MRGGFGPAANGGGVVADGTYQLVNKSSQLVAEAAGQGTASGA